MFLIWLLQFEQEEVNEPHSKGEIAYPPRLKFTAIPTEHASFCIYELELEIMLRPLTFPFLLHPAQKNAHPISRGIIIHINITITFINTIIIYLSDYNNYCNE